MRLIGLSGYAQSGKDTVAKFLVEDHGFTRVAFADKLREVALAIDPLVETGLLCKPLSLVLKEEKGWDGAKKYAYVREFLQRLGTEVVRNIFGENTWVDLAFRDLDPEGSYVFTDVRFPNEWQAINHRGGSLWRITRPGYGAVNGHVSETALNQYHFQVGILNKGTLEELREKVAAVVASTSPIRGERLVGQLRWDW